MMKTKPPRTSLLDAWRCRRTVRSWKKNERRSTARQKLLARVRALPYWHEIGQMLYVVGFLVEYTLIRLGRSLGWFAGLFLRGFVQLLGILIRPLAPPDTGQAAARFSPVWLLQGALLAASAGLLAWTVYTGLDRSYVLQVEVNGSTVGYVASEQVFEGARTTVYERIQNAQKVLEEAGRTSDASGFSIWPTYTLTTDYDHTMGQTELVNALLLATGGELQEATAVYLDDELQYVTTEGDHLRSYLQNTLLPYEDVDDPNQRVDFVHDIQLVDGLFFSDSVQPYSDVLTRLSSDEGLLQVRTIERQTYEEEIPYPVYTEESAAYDFGETVVLQAGQNGLRRITQDVTIIDGVQTDIQTVQVETLSDPVPEQRVTGTQLKDYMYGSIGGYDFIWPAPGYRHISQWMVGNHTGVDITGPSGTPILAAASGTVVQTYTWNGIVTRGDWNSYGNYVVIEHEGGYSTRYAHMLQFIVSEGEYVEAGQVIGYMGSTGNSTGTHLHFEMYGPQGRFSARLAFPDIPVWNK